MSATQHLKVWLPSAGFLEKRWTLFLASAMLFTANLALTFPGQLTEESGPQLAEALASQFTDGHPPVMAWLWSWWFPAETGAASMLVFQLVFHWLGFLLFTDSLFYMGRLKTAWALLLAGASPFFIDDNDLITKDVGMASVFLAACGIILWHRVRQRRLPPRAISAIFFLMAYGTLVSANAIFAYGPLMIYAVASKIRVSRAREWFTASLVLAALAFPICSGVNRHVFSAKDSAVTQSLITFDLDGITKDTTDRAFLPRVMSVPADNTDRATTEKAVPKHDALISVLLWPITCFAMGAAFLFLTRGEQRDESLLAARGLAFSATLYLASLLVAGVFTDIRYAYWSTLAVMVASILGVDALLRNQWKIDHSGR